MPLLVCPNDNASMQSVQRHGVEFDFCPTCRGVWLDRGELEKLMAGSREEGGYDAPPPPREAPRRDDHSPDAGADLPGQMERAVQALIRQALAEDAA